jgi:hypothetical protein
LEEEEKKEEKKEERRRRRRREEAVRHALLWDFIHRAAVNPYRRLETTYRCHCQGQQDPREVSESIVGV